MHRGGKMTNTVKLYVVNCGGCNAKQVWDSSFKHKNCDECNSTVVLKTASPEELKYIKTQIGGSPIRFSNYLVYSLGVEDVDEAVAIKRERIKQMKTDVEDRKKFAQMEKMNFSFNGNGKNGSKGANFRTQTVGGNGYGKPNSFGNARKETNFSASSGKSGLDAAGKGRKASSGIRIAYSNKIRPKAKSAKEGKRSAKKRRN